MPNAKVALCGRMRSGKDATAAYLMTHYRFARFAFGDGIKRLCRELFPDQFEGNRKPRALLQGVGQALREIGDPDVWINVTMRRISEWTPTLKLRGLSNIVITDLRQPNEYERLRAEGYVIIRINCRDDIRRQRMIDAGDTFDDADLTHETEQHVDSFTVDYELWNDGRLTDLYEQVDVVMREINGKVAA